MRGNVKFLHQRGAAAVEFALVAALFLLVLLFGVIDLGRFFFYMNATAEATRWGARTAVVCDIADAARIRASMQDFVSTIPAENLDFDIYFEPSGCVRGTCRSVTVSTHEGASYQSLIPLMPSSFTWRIPSFTTTLPTESLDSANDRCPRG